MAITKSTGRKEMEVKVKEVMGGGCNDGDGRAETNEEKMGQRTNYL